MDLDSVVKNRVKKVNSLMNSRSTENIKDGMVLIANSLTEFTSTNAIESFTVWVDILPNILSRFQHSSTNYLASFCFGKLIKNIRFVPSASREISTQKIPLVLSNLLQISSIKDPIPVLDCIHAILEHFHSSCTSLKSKTIKYLSPLLSSDVDTIQIKAAKCWRLLPYIGPSGVQNTEHVKNWEMQMNEALNLLTDTTNSYLNKDVPSGIKNMGYNAIMFNQVPDKEPELSIHLSKKYCLLTVCIKHLLSAKFSAPVRIPFNSLVDILLECLDLSPSSMGHTSEMLLRIKQLPNMQCHALLLLREIISVCGEHGLVYSTIINKTIINLLDQAHQPQLRANIHDFIMTWVERSSSMFLCGSETQNEILFQHFKDDIAPKNPNEKVAIKVSATKKRKRTSVASQQNVQNNENSFDLSPSLNALTALNMCFCRYGGYISANTHKNCQKLVVTLLLQSQQKLDMSIFTKSSKCCLLLYELLFSLITNPSCYVVPPYGYARTLFQRGLADNSMDIRVFCQQSLSSCGNALYVNPASIHSCNIDLSLVENTTRKFIDNEVIIEPVTNGFPSPNIKENHVGMTINDSPSPKVNGTPDSPEEPDVDKIMNELAQEENDDEVNESQSENEEILDDKMQVEDEEELNGWSLRQESPNVLLSTSSCHSDNKNEDIFDKGEPITDPQITPQTATELEDSDHDISDMLNDFIDTEADSL